MAQVDSTQRCSDSNPPLGDSALVKPMPPFRAIGDLLREHAKARPQQPALVYDGAQLTWQQLDEAMDRVALALQRDGLVPGDVVVLCGANALCLASVFLGALRAGIAVAPLAYNVTQAAFQAMLQDAAPKRVFVDSNAAELLAGLDLPHHASAPWIALDEKGPGIPLEQWLAPAGGLPARVEIRPEDPFNIIYSSGTTGIPKGIVQPHAMRWAHIHRGAQYDYSENTVTLVSTPLYSNTTLVVVFPTLAFGGTVHLLAKFDAGRWLAEAARHRVTHAMLVPVQYQRLLGHADFDSTDLSAFKMKFCTSAPFSAALKSDALRRWPGGLVEFYGMTEGGGTCILEAHLTPEQLHTVGRPAQGHDIRLIDDAGLEVGRGATGEVVGHSPGMMTGYYNQPEKTREAEWFAPDGKRFIRTGDIGRFNDEGFLVLMDRKKDMIISGGFNIYPSDLEAVLLGHPNVREAAVVGVPSVEWGETPAAFVVRREGSEPISADTLRSWANDRLGKTQRIAQVLWIDELPRSAIGKVLKRELRGQVF